ncbi:hypothetical protein GTV32_12885 [Gordonia sp. SID5947]|uniref:hypothetical protein n=1 Tax=Gordonia sp. SID5947 TaxID=2690315 RepID=UPI00136EA2B5|nr:hypothetical protein [Gordonia sp. SID5947]MYR07146.1 hypothetical protein [Gordonia sp. SID5947]
MSIARLRQLPRSASGAGLLLTIAMAIVLMHTVVAHCATGGEHSSSAAGHPQPSTVVQSAQHEILDDTSMSGTDCGLHQHACVFVRAGDPDVIVLAVLVLAWGFPIPPLLRSVRGRLRLRAGRPPPWAVLTHLQLQVIRC